MTYGRNYTNAYVIGKAKNKLISLFQTNKILTNCQFVVVL